MATKVKNFNYFIREQEGGDVRGLTGEIATFFASQYKQKITIITKRKIEIEEAERLFGTLSKDERRLIALMYCKNYKVVLDKLLQIDSTSSIPKVLIIESLHQWYNETTDLEQIPSVNATIIGTAQDLVNTCSRMLNQSCFSFISSLTDEFPTSIIDLFYDFPITAGENCLDEVFHLHENNR